MQVEAAGSTGTRPLGASLVTSDQRPSPGLDSQDQPFVYPAVYPATKPVESGRRDFLHKLLILLATPAGFEPATFSLEGCCSIP